MAENTLGRVVIAGGSGFLGLALAQDLTAAGYEVVILSRSVPKSKAVGRHVAWDARSLGDWQGELDGAVGLVNLTGRSVDCVKTPDYCDEILRSRVESTAVLGQAVRSVDRPPPVWVQMSTAHIYGDPPEVVCTEDSATGYGLAPTVAKAWEATFAEAVLPTQRQVILRTSFVLGRNRGGGGGALTTLRKVTRFCLGGTVGHGRQGLSWLHETDMVRILRRSLEDATMRGVYIASTPQPVSQRDFMRAMRKTVGMPIGLPATETMIRLGAHWVLRTDPELILYGRYVVPEKLLREGFEFTFPELEGALRDLA